MKRVAAAALILFMTFCLSTVWAGPTLDRIISRGELVVGSSGDYPPLTARAKDGALIGMDIDLANAIAAAMGVRVRIVQVPFSKLLDSLQAGRIDMIISCMTMSPERNLKFAFVGPYMVSGQSLLMTQATATTIRGLQDINAPDFTLAVPKGTTSEQIAINDLRRAGLTVAADMDEAVALLSKGKVKAVMSDAAACAYVILRRPEKGFTLTPALTFEPLGIAVPGNDPLLVNWLTNFLATAKGNGILNLLENRWFKDASWLQLMP